MIKFSEVINLSSARLNTEPKTINNTLLMSCEVDSTINQFYIDNNRTASKNGILTLLTGLYADTPWSLPYSPVTTQRVASIGVKNFPGVGCIAFYNLLDEERSGILSPVFIKGNRFTRPTLVSAIIKDGTLQVEMQSPNDIEYEAFRFIMRSDDAVFEYVTYENISAFTVPHIAGTYECYCVGYKGEGEAVSSNSNVRTLIVEEKDASENLAEKRDIYVKATTLTPEGFLKLTLSNDTDILLPVVIATKQEVTDATEDKATKKEVQDSINEAIQDTWEASY